MRPTKAGPLPILQTVTRMHHAMEHLERGGLDDSAHVMLERAIDTIRSVLIIYLGRGREPRIQSRHMEGVEHFDWVLRELNINC
jgi:hypothetical protein